VIKYLFNEKAAYTIHLNGLNHMVASKDGLENFGLDGLIGAMALKSVLSSYEISMTDESVIRINYFSTLITGLLPRYKTPDQVSKRFRKTTSLPHWY
jgi:hypothetical protein